MVEEPTENKSPDKLLLDKPDDFKFHIAYEVYSKAWDENNSEAARLRLNELITSLVKEKDDYSSFYAQIQEYRRDLNSFRAGRTRIRTERKRAWQNAETRDGRNRRHK